MRHNQCKFCTSRSCYEIILSEDGKYTEICCMRHGNELWDDFYANTPTGTKRMWSQSTGKVSRRETYEKHYAQFLKYHPNPELLSPITK